MLRIGRRYIEGGTYLAGIDGLRAVAVLAVIMFHLVPAALPGGFVGVDVFFVISGYVVTNSMLRQNDSSVGRFVLNFYARRFRRIVPPLVCCLCVTIPVAFAFIPDAWLSIAIPSTALSAFFGVSNFALIATNDGYFATQAGSNPFTHTWSLAVEEQFYLLFPPILYGAFFGVRGRTEVAARWIFAALFIGSFLFSAWATEHLSSVAYYSLPSRFWELAIGAAAAMLGEPRRESFVKRIGHATLMNAGIVLIAATMVFANEHHFPVPWAIPACGGSLAVVLASGFPSDCRSLGTILEQPLVVATGLMSYSLYLWHWPIFTVMRWTIGLDTPLSYLIALSLTVSLAWLTFVLVEIPAQHWPIFRRARASLVIAVGVALMGSGFMVSRFIYHYPQRFKMTVVERNRYDWYPYWGGGKRQGRMCDVAETWDGKDLTMFLPINCLKNAPQGQHIYVIGDSHAGAYNRMLRNVVSETGLPVAISSTTGCAEADFLLPAAARKSRCGLATPYIDAVLRHLKIGDIVFLASLRSVRLSDQDGPISKDGIAHVTTSAWAQERRTEARHEGEEIIERISATGASVILDLPQPVFRAPAFRCSDWFNSSNPVCALGLVISRRDLLKLRTPVVASILSSTQGHPNVFVWDPFPILCPTDPCSAVHDGRPLFFDGDHLSGYGNDRLTPSFLSLIEQVTVGREARGNRRHQ